MQERVLGSIIMGGIAVLGVVWAVIEGVPPLINAQKQEGELETKLVSIVSKDYDSSISTLDVKRASFVTVDVEVDYRGGKKTIPMPIVSLEGYNNKDELFVCEIMGSNDYIPDLQNKIGSRESSPYTALEYDIYQNYSMTLAKILNEMVSDEDTEFLSYAISDELYGRVQSDAGATIYEIGEITGDYADAKIYTPEEVITEVKDFQYGEKSEAEQYVYGEIESIESKLEVSGNITYYTIRLKTQGVDEAHRVEIYSAKLLNSKLNPADLVVGNKVLVKGYLSTNMAYKEVTK